jgi:hypothetical protein
MFIFFFFFKNCSKLGQIDSKCSGLECSLKSLVRMENISGRLNPYSYGTSCYAAERKGISLNASLKAAFLRPVFSEYWGGLGWGTARATDVRRPGSGAQGGECRVALRGFRPFSGLHISLNAALLRSLSPAL